MRVLLVHNRYKQRGGEDVVFEAEEALLRSRGVEVRTHIADNVEIDRRSKVRTAIDTIWSLESYRTLRRVLSEFRPDVVHFHNTFPMLSPAVYDACRAQRVPVVQTLHNYRLICPNALCFRDGAVCLDCVGKLVPVPAVKYSCYRGSRLETLGVATMLSVHRVLRTWATKVDAYIALTRFSRDLLVRGGLPVERIYVKPNFLSEDPGVGNHEGGYFLFVGRLSPEKGVSTLLEAWELLGDQAPPLQIAGTGPLAPEVEAAAARLRSITFLGQRSRDEVYALMRNAAALVLPSVCFEGFPMTLVEGFATGTPILASDLGNLSSLVVDGETGLLFAPGEPRRLADRVLWLANHPGEARQMARRARAEYEQLYSAKANFTQLMAIYEKVTRRQAKPKAVEGRRA